MVKTRASKSAASKEMAESKAKAKRIELTELSSGSSSDVDLDPKAKGKGMARDKSGKQGKGSSQGSWTTAQFKERLELISFPATRYPNPEFLRAVGLFDDMEEIFGSMGLRKFMSLASNTYVDLVKEFLISLRVHFHNHMNHEWDDAGYIEFDIDETSYKVSFGELAKIYGLQMGMYLSIEDEENEPAMLWNAIGAGAYLGGLTKAARIRPPALRYAYKALTNTFYGRRSKSAVTHYGMKFLLLGAKPFASHLNGGNGIQTNKHDVSLVGMFVKEMVDLRQWVMTTKDATPQICTGGLLTPLFKAKEIALTGESAAVEWIDKFYLKRQGYLTGYLNNSYAYKFYVSAVDQVKILLPQVEVTTLRKPENLSFQPGQEYLYDNQWHGNLTPITKTKFPTSAQAGPSNANPSPPRHKTRSTYGCSRYNFQPFDEPISNPAIKKAHEHIRVLQRFTKWQSRCMQKMADQIKGMKKTIKTLERKFTGASSSHHQPMEGEFARHSFQDMPQSESGWEDLPRASSYEPRQHGPKKRARQSPTPSPPGSSNESYSFEDSSSMN